MLGIVAGMPARLVGTFRTFRKKNSSKYRDGWDIQHSPVAGKFIDINVKELNCLMEHYRNDSPHIFSFRPQNSEQQRWVQENVVPYFRFRWLPNTLILNDPDWANYLEEMSNILEEEERWDQRIKPHDITSPLLLPEEHFRAKASVRKLWVDATKSDGQRIDAVVKKMHRFKEFHESSDERSRKMWLDQSSNVYCFHGERHGVSPFPRSVKYSFAIPDGFHFDVSSSNKSTVSLGSKTKSYLNVDPHGFIRD